MRRLAGCLGLLVVMALLLSCAKEVSNEAPVQKVVEREVVREVPSGAPAGQGGAGGVVSSTPPSEPAPAAPTSVLGEPWATDRMIVRTATMRLKVRNVTQVLDRVIDLAGQLGGYEVSHSRRGGEEDEASYISIRVPVARYDDAMKSLRAMAVEVLFEQAKSQDVTDEYTDMGSQLRNLEATERRYLELFARADTVEDMLKIEVMLSDVRDRIEKTKGRMQALEKTSATSLIEVYLVEERALEVDFVVDKIEVNQGEPVMFSDQTKGGTKPYGYSWEFGDGDTSTEGFPIHSYEDAGTYDVALKVTDVKGAAESEVKEGYITVVAKPGWSPSRTAKGAWRGMIIIGQTLGKLLIWIAILAIIWLPITLVVIWARRRRRRIRR